ncbi:hypothetical protein GQ53DRAFT_665395 [Thozetella sp. PMI_491]|nr:hypothetical protein GQ53DRAFT_665395 [Thozetella sp. PMI_491]
MAPQTSIPVAANVLGTMGTTADRVKLIPQLWTNWRTKKTDGLPGSMLFLWALCGVPFGTYSIVQNFNIPIQVQPQIFMTLCLMGWSQTLIYHHKWAPWKAGLLGVVIAGTFAGAEAALILTLRPVYENGNETPIFVVGIIASVILAIGLLPPYGEIWKRRGRVIGINWVFLSMDWLASTSRGAFFSLMALVAQDTFDTLGGVLYIICCFLEIGIFVSHIIWLIRTRSIRKEAAAQGKTFDDVLSEHQEQDLPFRFAERKSRGRRKLQADEEMAREGTPNVSEETEKPVDSGRATQVVRGEDGMTLGARAEM